MTYKSIRTTLLFCCLFGAACAANQTEKPEMSDDQLATLMADLFVADAATATLNGPFKDSMAMVYYQQVFDLHGTTKDRYKKDLEIIAIDPLRLEKIINQAGDLVKIDSVSAK